jgi:Holliday junction resolvasome RuvABC endonuclease subunit
VTSARGRSSVPNFVGIDPAANTGLVAVDATGRFVARLTVSPPSGLALDVRLAITAGKVRDFLETYLPDRIGVEVLRKYLAKNATTASFGIQAQFVGAVRSAIGAYAAPVVEQQPPCVVGRGRNRRVVGLPTKQIARAMLRGAWGDMADQLTEHEVDAAMIARETAARAQIERGVA